jgi:hypothetical protein
VPPEYATAIAATMLEVFPDIALWIDPETGTGILLGRASDGAAGPLGTRWPGLARERERGLSPERIRRALMLRGEAMARYAHGVPPITDDRQELAYGLLRHAAGGDRWHERRGAMMRANLFRIRHFAGGGS